MMNDKMVAAIEKKLNVSVVKEYGTKKISDCTTEVTIGIGGFDGMVVTLGESRNQHGPYYKVVDVRDILLTGERAEEIAAEAPVSEEPMNEEMDETEAMANLQAAQKFSETKNAPVFVMSNGKRTAVVKTDSNKARHEKYGYWVAAIFENGVQVSA